MEVVTSMLMTGTLIAASIAGRKAEVPRSHVIALGFASVCSFVLSVSLLFLTGAYAYCTIAEDALCHM